MNGPRTQKDHDDAASVAGIMILALAAVAFGLFVLSFYCLLRFHRTSAAGKINTTPGFEYTPSDDFQVASTGDGKTDDFRTRYNPACGAFLDVVECPR